MQLQLSRFLVNPNKVKILQTTHADAHKLSHRSMITGLLFFISIIPLCCDSLVDHNGFCNLIRQQKL